MLLFPERNLAGRRSKISALLSIMECSYHSMEKDQTWLRLVNAEIPSASNGSEVLETREWIDSLDYVLSAGGPERAGRLLQQLSLHARRAAGVNLPFTATTPYQNTIPPRQQPPFPGSQEMERRIKSLVRWNALAMVVRANKIQEGIGGHISTFRLRRHAV